MEGISYINNISLNRDHILEENNELLFILFINNVINNSNEFNNVEELHNEWFIRNFRIINFNGKENLDLVRIKVITIIIDKLPVNRDVLDYLNIIKKIDFKNFGVLDNIWKIIKKRWLFLRKYLNEFK